ncbi:MAG: zinc-ribbon domain-containing protein [Candidatus Odinarchaeota archaeon]
MVYCHKCGAENAEDADFCKKCGAPLAPKDDFGRRMGTWGRRFGERAEEECFGVTGGGAIFGIIIGIIIIGLGFSLVYGLPLWLLIGPIIGIIIGALIIVCALNSIRRKRSLRKQE